MFEKRLTQASRKGDSYVSEIGYGRPSDRRVDGTLRPYDSPGFARCLFRLAWRAQDFWCQYSDILDRARDLLGSSGGHSSDNWLVGDYHRSLSHNSATCPNRFTPAPDPLARKLTRAASAVGRLLRPRSIRADA